MIQNTKIELLENPKYYIALTALFRNEDRFLKEWIEFYKLIGVEHFYLFNHLSTDNYMLVLEPYIKEGIVDLKHLTKEPRIEDEWYNLQNTAYIDIIKSIKDDVEWLIIVDTDEFLYPVTERSLKPVLQNYDDYAGLVVNWRMFGSNNVQRIQDNELLIEKLVKRNSMHDLNVKSIIKPRYVDGFNTHYAITKPGYLQVTENYQIFNEYFSLSPSNSILTINHYYSRDLEFFKSRKLARIHILDKNLSDQEKNHKITKLLDANKQLSSVYDDNILKFASALRQAMFHNQSEIIDVSKTFIEPPNHYKIFALPNDLIFVREKQASYSLLNGYGIEPYLVRKIMAFTKSGETYLEINPEYGELALQMSAKLGHNGQIHAFESNMTLYQYFSTNIFLNNIANIHLTNIELPLSLGSHLQNIDIIRLHDNICDTLRGAQNIIDSSLNLRLFIKWQSFTEDCLPDLIDKDFILIDIMKFNEECSYLNYQQNYQLLSINELVSSGVTELLVVRNDTFHRYRQHYSQGQECIDLANNMMFKAAMQGKREEVKYALAHGAEINYYDETYNGPALYYAVATNHSDIVNLLLAQGADVELGYKRIVTPLYFAAEHGYYDIVEILLSYNASKDFTFFERTPAQIAEFNGHTEVVALLSGDIATNV